MYMDLYVLFMRAGSLCVHVCDMFLWVLILYDVEINISVTNNYTGICYIVVGALVEEQNKRSKFVNSKKLDIKH